MLSLHLLPDSRALDPQPVLRPPPDLLLRALDRERQQHLHAVLARQLDQVGLAAQREDRVLQPAGDGVSVGLEGGRSSGGGGGGRRRREVRYAGCDLVDAGPVGLRSR